jgi:ureidoglycolate amidohydrolase
VPNRSIKNKPIGVISAAEGRDDAAVRRTMEELASFPAYNDGEGPSSDFRIDSEGLYRQVRS